MDPLAPEALARWCQRTIPDDPRAFEQLVRQYKGRVFATAYRVLGNAQDAEDQTQEVFLKVFRSIKTLDDPAMLTAWILRITVNTCLNVRERASRRPQTVPLEPQDTPPGEPATQYADAGRTPEEQLLQREVQHCIEQTLAELTPEVRSILVLRDLEDRAYDEIASILEVGLSAVKMRIHRARLAFQHLIERICPETARREVR